MGKRRGGKNNFKKGSGYGQDLRKQLKGDDNGFNEWDYSHPVFEAYYRLQFEEAYFKEDKSEFDLFWNKLKEKLPVVFRVNKLIPNHQVFLKQIKENPTLLQDIAAAKKKLLAEGNNTKIVGDAAEATSNEDQKEGVDSSIAPVTVDGQATAIDEEKEKQGELEEVQIKNERFEFSDEQIANLRIQPISFYPDDLVWQINCNRPQLKKSKLLKEFHSLLQRSTDSGIVSRQELVSMLPPLFLNVEADDIVFDMCAAPGSKTAQLLEIMAGKGGLSSQGAVVANDVDEQRAFLLTHQVSRINPSGLVVINHPAQFFPRLADASQPDGKFYFDKVQADVPCSGDGATRKIPTQWQNWSTRDGQILHPLQLAILQRALTLCKVGGQVIYSTCSINPIEDEAVITEAFRRVTNDSIELVDIHDQLPTLKGRKGLTNWKVYTSMKKGQAGENSNPRDLLKLYENFEDVRQTGDRTSNFLRSSLFPEAEDVMINKIKIQHTMRILPHDQDTGGFYLALIKKTAPIQWMKKRSDKSDEANDDDDLPDASEIPKEAEKLQNIDLSGNDEGQQAKPPAKGEDVKESFVTISDEEWANIQENYGFEGLAQTRFVNNVIGKQKVIRFITNGAVKFNNSDPNSVVNIVNMGTKALERSRETFQGNQCRFRICQDSVNLLGPFMTKRKILISAEEFKFFVINKNAKYSEIPNQALSEDVKKLGQGTVVLFCEAFNDYIVCQNFNQTVSIMTNKEATESFKIRYFGSDSN